jgi:hypothetical protein
MAHRTTILRRRTRWYDALESGDYRRVTGTLTKTKADGTPKGFCCLGVACEIAGVKHTVINQGAWESQDDFVRIYGEDQADGHLPSEAQDWLGVCTSDPRPNFPKGHARYGASASELNDNGWTFKKIADAFRKYGIHPDDEEAR